MNKRAENDETFEVVIYTILLVIFVVPLTIFVYQNMNGASVWEDFYAKEIARVVNLAEIGDEFTLDVHKATEIGRKNEVPFSEMFNFRNEKNEICIRLSRGRTCYDYFRDVDIADISLDLGIGKDGGNVLNFKIIEKKKQEIKLIEDNK